MRVSGHAVAAVVIDVLECLAFGLLYKDCPKCFDTR